MRNLILILITLLSLNTSQAQSGHCSGELGDPYKTVFSLVYDDSDHDPVQALAPFLFGWISSICMQDGGWRGLKFSGWYDVKVRYFNSKDRTIAYAHSPLEGDVTIMVDADKWLELSKEERAWLMAHEYMHEKYGTPHGEGALMFPVIPDLSRSSGLIWEDRKSKLYSAFIGAWSILDDEEAERVDIKIN